MPFKETCSACCGVTFGSNFARLVWATVLHIAGIVLTIINLAVASSTPREALSWARFDIADAHFNMGLLKYQVCYQGVCTFANIDGIHNDEGNTIEAGRGAITACTFAMLFALMSVIILWLWIADKADKLRFPRIILQITNFLSLTLYIVAISTYYKLAYNKINGFGIGNDFAKNIMPGYSIAIGIVVIVASFFAWAFTFWRICRPNKNEPVREKKVKAPKNVETTEGAATSTTALETAKAQQQADEVVEGQSEPGSDYASSSKGGYGGGGAYGGSYGNGNAYANNDDSGSAYGNSSSGGAYGNSNSAYGNSGGAYSQKESAYGY